MAKTANKTQPSNPSGVRKNVRSASKKKASKKKASKKKASGKKAGGKEGRLDDEIRVRIDPAAKIFAAKTLHLKYPSASLGIRAVIGDELKSILKAEGQDLKQYKKFLDRFYD